MAIQQPIASDKLDSPSHSKLHRVIASDSSSPDESLVIDASGNVSVIGAITQGELSADPADPAEGKSVTWQSDGTGSGNDGDIMMKITAGGVTKTTTLVDFSEI